MFIRDAAVVGLKTENKPEYRIIRDLAEMVLTLKEENRALRNNVLVQQKATMESLGE